MERSDNTVRSGDDETAIASSRFPTSAALVAAIKRGETAAIRELFILYAPLLRDQARLMSVDSAERETFVTTLLDDIVLHLIDTPVAPRGLARYLVASLRNRARNFHRDGKQTQTSLESSYSRIGETQLVLAELHSEYGIRSAISAVDDPSLRAAIAKLAERSAAVLTEEELRLMVAVGRHMPLREFAEQNGMSYANARVRLHRLRARFAKLTAQYLTTLDVAEKREVERFLRRAGVRLAEGAEQAQGSGSPHHDHKVERTHGHT